MALLVAWLIDTGNLTHIRPNYSEQTIVSLPQFRTIPVMYTFLNPVTVHVI